MNPLHPRYNPAGQGLPLPKKAPLASAGGPAPVGSGAATTTQQPAGPTTGGASMTPQGAPAATAGTTGTTAQDAPTTAAQRLAAACAVRQQAFAANLGPVVGTGAAGLQAFYAANPDCRPAPAATSAQPAPQPAPATTLPRITAPVSSTPTGTTAAQRLATACAAKRDAFAATIPIEGAMLPGQSLPDPWAAFYAANPDCRPTNYVPPAPTGTPSPALQAAIAARDAALAAQAPGATPATATPAAPAPAPPAGMSTGAKVALGVGAVAVVGGGVWLAMRYYGKPRGKRRTTRRGG